MNRPLIATCDECEGITTIDFKTRVDGEFEETYFNCEICDKHYSCFVTDEKVRQLHRVVDKLKQLSRVTGKNPTDEILELQKEINERMAKLKSDRNVGQ